MAAPSVHLDLPGDVEKATGPHHVEKATGPHHTEKAHRPHHTKKADRPHHTEVAAGSQTQTSPVPSSPSRVGKDDVEMADGGPQHTEKVDTPHHTEKVDRPHHTEKVDTPHHTEKVDRPHHNEVAAGSQTQTSPVPSSPSRVGKDDVEMADGGPQHTEKVDTPHHTEKVDRPHHTEKVDRPHHTEKVDTPHHTEKVDRPHHNEVAAGSQTQTSPVPSSPSRVGKIALCSVIMSPKKTKAILMTVRVPRLTQPSQTRPMPMKGSVLIPYKPRSHVLNHMGSCIVRQRSKDDMDEPDLGDAAVVLLTTVSDDAASPVNYDP
ncbi:hypothetical protein INR49_032983, partial [Caranx melampygus]